MIGLGCGRQELVVMARTMNGLLVCNLAQLLRMIVCNLCLVFFTGIMICSGIKSTHIMRIDSPTESTISLRRSRIRKIFSQMSVQPVVRVLISDLQS